MEYVILFSVLFYLVSCFQNFDPCKIERTLNFLEKRTTDNVLKTGQRPLCDRDVIHGDGEWFKSTGIIATNYTRKNTCVTLYGIWLNGSSPSLEDGLVSRKACVPSASYSCEKIYNVSIQNCGEYNVYYLPRPTACPEAYCFEKDPCSTPRRIPYEPLRRTVYKKLPGDIPICDKYHIRKEGEWFMTSNKMVNISSQALACGTIHGIWIRGNYPEFGEGIVERTACVPGNNANCSKSYQIKAKNCGNYSVYFLRRPTSCPEAYCFGYGEIGPSPVISTEKPSVRYKIVVRKGRMKYETLEFKCLFIPLSDDSIFYEVYWYLNNKIHVIMEPVKKIFLDKSNLKEENGLKLGFDIQCAIRLKFRSKGAPGPSSPKSDPFYAGIKILGAPVALPPGGHVPIEFLLTVPFQCSFYDLSDSQPENCRLAIEMALPDFLNCNKDTSASLCGLEISRSKWNVTHSFQIQNTMSQTWTNVASHKYIEFRVNSALQGDIWRTSLQETVTVFLQYFPEMAMVCKFIPSVHMTTFMDVRFDNVLPGTFMMYSSKDDLGNPLQVQIKKENHACLPLVNYHCVCGVAVRAAGDVFIKDDCSKKSTAWPSTNFKSCIDNLLDVRKFDESHFKIYFQSGTYVEIRRHMLVNLHVLSVLIHASPADVKKSTGLCGTVGNSTLIGGDGVVHTYSIDTQKMQPFSRSWSIDANHDLFKMNFEEITSLPVKGLIAYPCLCESAHSRSLTNAAYCDGNRGLNCTRNSKIEQSNACRIKPN